MNTLATSMTLAVLGIFSLTTPSVAGALTPPQPPTAIRGTPPLAKQGAAGGATVETRPKVYLIFWGQWQGATCANPAASPVPVMSSVIGLFNGIANSRGTQAAAYRGILTQYGVGATTYGGCWLDPAAPPADSLTQAQFVAEIQKALNPATPNRPAGWAAGVNSQFMIFPENGRGITINGAERNDLCGYHSWAIQDGTTYIYDAEPYLNGNFFNGCTMPQPGVAGQQLANAMTSVATHEWAEAATDPYVGSWNNMAGWATTAELAAGEIGDLCTYPAIRVPGLGYVEYLWSNAANGCVGSYVLRGAWGCSSGFMDMDFNPPLTNAGAGMSDVTITNGTVANCTIPGNTSGTPVTSVDLDNFSGRIGTNCASLNGPAPNLTGGIFQYLPDNFFMPSSNVTTGVGAVTSVQNHLAITYAGGRIGTGSFRGALWMQALSTASIPELQIACRGGGVGFIRFSDNGR